MSFAKCALETILGIRSTAEASLMVTAAFGIAWVADKAMTGFFERKRIYFDAKSQLPDLHPATMRFYENQARDYALVSTIVKRVGSFNPLVIAGQYGRSYYDRYFGSNGHRQY